ncbi:hypothetical protein N836_14755 [Leptolyngbya sp. Heron Island J]|uniref:hypothetical protein n=1 Tax=Leptolyngbya sp. Heron Island J TaxID=1385935 RepID=UPI0003B9D9FC|nr:hypothetical protein [Leptolyngbya sp. Heron Island J]ESA35018.1 hypothetical protein N836_14755 [Leptolyngbya sp. Heron Island J]
MSINSERLRTLINRAQRLTEAEALADLPIPVTERLKTESSTPLVAALGLSDALWIDNPYKGEKGASRAVRVIQRDEALIRALAFYRLKGGKDLEKTAAFFEETFATESKHDGQVKHAD